MTEVSWASLVVVFGDWRELVLFSSFSAAFLDLLLVFFEAGGCFEALALRAPNGVARDLGERVFFWAFGMMAGLSL